MLFREGAGVWVLWILGINIVRKIEIEIEFEFETAKFLQIADCRLMIEDWFECARRLMIED